MRLFVSGGKFRFGCIINSFYNLQTDILLMYIRFSKKESNIFAKQAEKVITPEKYLNLMSP